MKTLLIIITLFYTLSTNALDLAVGAGWLPMADGQKGEAYSITVIDKKYKYSIANFGEYGRTPWYPWQPTWGQYIQDSHYVVSALREVHSHDVGGGITFYIDFGFAYASKESRVNSSHLLFTENFGFKYLDWFLYWRHTSNAGIKGVNTGEDAIMLEYSFSI